MYLLTTCERSMRYIGIVEARRASTSAAIVLPVPGGPANSTEMPPSFHGARRAPPVMHLGQRAHRAGRSPRTAGAAPAAAPAPHRRNAARPAGRGRRCRAAPGREQPPRRRPPSRVPALARGHCRSRRSSAARSGSGGQPRRRPAPRSCARGPRWCCQQRHARRRATSGGMSTGGSSIAGRQAAQARQCR